MKLSEAVERLIAQAQEAVDEKARELEPERVLEALAAQGIHPPEGEGLSDGEYNDLRRRRYELCEEERERLAREVDRRRYERLIANKIQIVNSELDSVRRPILAFQREAKICAHIYGEMDVEQFFYFRRPPQIVESPFAVLLTDAAIIQTGQQADAGRPGGAAVMTVMHMLDDIDRVDAYSGFSGNSDEGRSSLSVHVNLHRAGSSGIVPLTWNWASGNIETAERFLGALAAALHRRAAARLPTAP